MEAVLENHRTAPIPEADKALFDLLEKAATASPTITAEDVAAARQAGWSDDALYDAITVCALFRFYNTWIDATGVHDMPAMAYGMSGKRLAAHGYVMEAPPKP